MFKRIYSKVTLAGAKVSLRFMLKNSDAELKKKKNFDQIIEFMSGLESNLVTYNQLNSDLTQGPVDGRTKSTRKLINAFVINRELKQEDSEGYYIHVARNWVEARK
ncbi:hypothetical protein VBD025_14630 [Virgibacillus flavescens]|uniref:hypothetical protein n=1 Tax=Virgibacillus flavescens TaxID=1611422 RepID=UPI003D32552B